MTVLSVDQLAELENDLLDLQEQVLGISDLFPNSDNNSWLMLNSLNPVAIRGNQSNVENQSIQLANIEKALERIDNDLYGYCVVCRKMMGFSYLKMQPTVERCAVCG